MWGPIILIIVGFVLVYLGNAIGKAGGGTDASTLGCFPGIVGLLCILGGSLWAIIALALWLF